MILIAAAVENELSGIVSHLSHPAVSCIGDRKIIAGKLGNLPVRLVVTGPGLVNAVQSLTAAIEHKKPSLLVQTGCAGAFRQSGLQVGDIGIATAEIDAHLGIESETDMLPLPFSILNDKGIELRNRYPLDQALAETAADIIRTGFEKTDIQVTTGPFVTVSTITATDNTADRYYNKFGAIMEAMEGSGAAHVAIHYDIPFLEIRAASNLVGKRDRNAWNLPLAFERCGATVRAWIRGVKITRRAI